MGSLGWNWARIGLIASLALNVFFVAAVATHWIGRGDREFAGGPESGGLIVGLPSPRDLYGVLTESEQEVLTAEMNARKPAYKKTFGAIFDARERVANALDTEDFRRVSLEKAFTELRRHQMKLTATSQSMIVDLAAQLEEPGRRRLGNLMRPHYPDEESVGNTD